MPRDQRSFLRWVRADDMLSLGFEFRNLEIEHRYRKPARLVRIEDADDAFLVVHFPGQHIAEQAFSDEDNRDNAIPVESRIARPSRLVFRLPESLPGIDITADSLLGWEALELMVPADAEQRQPGADESLIELPYGLSLTPPPDARWRHARHPVTYNGRTEIWHTQLPTDELTSLKVLDAGYDTTLPPRSSPNRQTRDALVGRSVDARTLILSPVGGWLDVRGRWDEDVKLARWEHSATAGQDQHVLVEGPEGHIFPFGHKARLITVTERVLETMATPGGTDREVALLRQSYFIVIKEPTRRYKPGAMAFRTITVDVETTPALLIPDAALAAADDEDIAAVPYWIETAAEAPFLFPMTAIDWDGQPSSFQAPAVFVPFGGEASDALAEYDRDDYVGARDSDLRGQAAVVALYRPPATTLSPEGSDDTDHSPGDTMLRLLRVRFSGDLTDDEPGFSCTTSALEARLPSLEQYLDDNRNRGWFELVDPDSNEGEVFALARGPDTARIPMHFDDQADMSGGLAAPSFNVGGISRIYGPVGDADGVMKGEPFNPAAAFEDSSSNLLGSFPLIALLNPGSAEEKKPKSPAIPKFYFKQKKLKNKDDDEEKKEQEKEKQNPDDPDTPPEEPDAGTDAEAEQEDKSKSAKESAGRAITLGLKWTIPLKDYGDEDSLMHFKTTDGSDDTAATDLVIDVSATRVFGKTKAKEKADDETPDDEKTADGDNNSANKGVTFAASGKLSNFELLMHMTDDTSLGFAFDYIEVKLGPPKDSDDEKKDNPGDEPAADADDDKEQNKSKVSTEVNFVLADVNVTGQLNFLKTVLEAMAKLPELPDIPQQEPSSDYPARMPSPGPADINVPIGPFDIPKFNFLSFSVQNVSVGGSIGLNFLPKPSPTTGDAEVPEHVFSFRLSSADKPMLLLAEPWGGIAHLGINFTPSRCTGFQFSLGVVYRVEFDLSVTTASCEGSLAGMFTSWVEGSRSHAQFDIVLKLSGQAKLWFVDIYILLVAVGSYQSTGQLWAFSASLTVRVRIAFFTVTTSFSFSYEIAGEGGRLASTAAPGDSPLDNERLAESDWHSYRRAFAGLA